MPKICRDGDLGKTGHLCHRYIGVIASQRSVLANGIPFARRGDRAKFHTILRRCGKYPCCLPHKSKINRGSTTVFAEGIGVARVWDSFDKAWMVRGSDNVFAGG
jgi:uncharacterized Zn-binding protein involved in type VI secretion|tara:strand:+ start:302 stop:613 length:312 start_codon:yes stop_codon:yes gene_type:complete